MGGLLSIFVANTIILVHLSDREELEHKIQLALSDTSIRMHNKIPRFRSNKTLCNISHCTGIIQDPSLWIIVTYLFDLTEHLHHSLADNINVQWQDSSGYYSKVVRTTLFS